jgi:hypothetical protein
VGNPRPIYEYSNEEPIAERHTNEPNRAEPAAAPLILGGVPENASSPLPPHAAMKDPNNTLETKNGMRVRTFVVWSAAVAILSSKPGRHADLSEAYGMLRTCGLLAYRWNRRGALYWGTISARYSARVMQRR